MVTQLSSKIVKNAKKGTPIKFKVIFDSTKEANVKGAHAIGCEN